MATSRIMSNQIWCKRLTSMYNHITQSYLLTRSIGWCGQWVWPMSILVHSTDPCHGTWAESTLFHVLQDLVWFLVMTANIYSNLSFPYVSNWHWRVLKKYQQKIKLPPVGMSSQHWSSLVNKCDAYPNLSCLANLRLSDPCKVMLYWI